MIRVLIVVFVLAGALWGVSQSFRVEAQQSVDAMEAAAISGASQTTPGASHGYVLPRSGELTLGGFDVREMEVSPPNPDCDDPGYVRVNVLHDGQRVGFEVEAYRIDESGFRLRARNAEAGLLLIDAHWADDALEAYQSGADAVDHFLTGRVMLGGANAENVEFAFWIGD